MEHKSGMSEKEIEECVNGMLEAMRGRVKNDKESGLTDNDVREVAKMQMVIDHYEDSLFRLSMFAEGRGDGNILVYDTDGDFWLRKLYNFIKEHREEKQ